MSYSQTFVIRTRTFGKFDWIFYAKNGKPVAESFNSYSSISDAERAIQQFQNNFLEGKEYFKIQYSEVTLKEFDK